jgi:hypothetical protein
VAPKFGKSKKNNLESFLISNGVIKNFLNLNVADIGAKKKRFKPEKIF